MVRRLLQSSWNSPIGRRASALRSTSRYTDITNNIDPERICILINLSYMNTARGVEQPHVSALMHAL